MEKRYIPIILFLMVFGGKIYSQNNLVNTTWETFTDSGNRQTIVFGENGFRWTGEPYYIESSSPYGQRTGPFPGRNEVGTYRVQGEMVYLSTATFTYTGILLGGTLNISGLLGVGWEFRRVQSSSNSQNNPQSNTQNISTIRIMNSTGYIHVRLCGLNGQVAMTGVTCII